MSIPNFGDYSNPAVVVDLATTAEEAGWDGFFVWDHIVVSDGMPVADPWVMLGAIARSTHRLDIGPMVTPLPRRRPWVLARQATTVDHLSDGRLTLGVGIGFPPKEEFGTFGEPTDERARADMLEEALKVLAGMWSGQPFAFNGEHYTVAETQFEPRPVRSPSIPIWVAGGYGVRRPLRRASRHDGYFPVKWDMTDWEPEQVVELREQIAHERGSVESFQIVIGGSVEAGRGFRDEYSEAGATWYLAGPSQGSSPQDVRRNLEAGPPPS